jgi:hypothetical protein
MTSTQISAWLTLFFGGLWAGGILIFAVERTNLWQRMPIDQYEVDFRRSLFRADPTSWSCRHVSEAHCTNTLSPRLGGSYVGSGMPRYRR